MKSMCFLFIIIFLSGCVSTRSCFENTSLEIKDYAAASLESKDGLRKDLRSGKVNIDTTLDRIRTAYGEPDNMLVSGCIVRIIYRAESGNITLWFDDGRHLSMWSD